MTIADWLQQEGWIILSWWALGTLAGAAALPYCVRFLRWLPDRGVIMARTLGLVLSGFSLWILVTVRVLQNTVIGIGLAWLVVIIVGGVLLRRLPPFDWRTWWREHRAAILTAELLFAAIFVLFCIYRAAQHDMSFGEKASDSMLIGSIMTSRSFPPEDAWLAGAPVVYYYFGQLFPAMLAMLSGVTNTAAHNLYSAMMVALAAQVSFGVGYNLVRWRGARRVTGVGFGLLSLIVVNVLGPMQVPLVEMPYQFTLAPDSYFEFWGQLDRLHTRGDGVEVSLLPGYSWTWGWWWHPANVMFDPAAPYSYMGDKVGIINEFPAFSYLVGEAHSHAVGFSVFLLLIGCGANLALACKRPRLPDMIFYGIVLGGMMFVITWNYPAGLLILVGGEVIRRLSQRRCLTWRDVRGVIGFALGLAAISLVAYAPFVVNVNPTYGGMVSNLYQGTQPQQLFLVMGTFLLLGAPFLIHQWRRTFSSGQARARFAWALGVLILLGLIAIMAVLAYHDLTRPYDSGYSATYGLAWIHPDTDMRPIYDFIIKARLDGIPTLVVMFAGLVGVLGILLPYPRGARRFPIRLQLPLAYAADNGYAVLLMGSAIGLLMVPEFFYYHDIGGVRSDTIFKVYLQAWLLFGIACVFGIYTLLVDRERRIARVNVRRLFAVFCVIVIVPNLIYMPAAYFSRSNIEVSYFTDHIVYTVDGGYTLATQDDYEALRCLSALAGQDEVTVASGVWSETGNGGLFTDYRGQTDGRVGSVTGLPTLIGVGFHEIIWRTYPTFRDIIGTRWEDTRTLYETPDINVAREIIRRYSLDYILYGQMEQVWYGEAGMQKFIDAGFPVVCEAGVSRVYRTY
ncbi:MAG: hypothetical protein IAE80_20940 [Anaerolinea sp.]|nr:hypothetical protein [Anaerolinea sp.]